MRRTQIELEQGVAAFGGLSRDELAGMWEKAYGCAPPKGVRNELLVRSASWHLQAKRGGGLSAATRRLLNAAIAEVEQGRGRRKAAPTGLEDRSSALTTGTRMLPTSSSASSGRTVATQPRKSLSPGDRLMREWNGRTHVVDVIEDGFVFEAKVHRSLTAIARQITGAHWSGPRFFGL